MARIETYVEDNQVTLNDIVIGSDGDNFNKTKNFRVSALTQFLESIVQDNIPKIVTYIVPENATIESVLESNNLTVTATDSPVILIFLQQQVQDFLDLTGSTVSALSVSKYVYLFPLGSGTYAPISDTVTLDDLVLLEATRPNQTDIESLDDAIIIVLGDLTGSNIVDDINAQNPSYDLSDNTKTYYFTYEQNGSLFLNQFVGTNGIYGLNDDSVVGADFIDISVNVIDDDNVKAKFIEVTLNATSFATESDEIDDFVREFNDLTPNVVVSDKELIVGFSDTLENDAGTSYRSVYIVNTGKGTYGTGAGQIATNNVIKVRGTRVDKNLSSYTNDLTPVDISGKLNKAGDTMSGTLNMGSNTIINLPTPTTNSQPATKQYVDELKSFRGEYTTESAITSLTSNIDGDYATLSNSGVEQLWVYQGDAWVLMSAKPRYVVLSANTTLNNTYHKSTIEVDTASITLDFPDSLINGFEVNIRNKAGGTINFTASGTNTITQATLIDDALATVINDGSEFVVDSTEVVEFDKINIGIYNYQDTQAAVTLVADTYTELSNNGAGTNTVKDPVPSTTDIYNTSTDRFDFSNLNLFDTVKVRIDLEITTVTVGEVVDCRMVLGEGQAGEYTLPIFSSKYFKDADTYRIVEEIEVFMGNSLTKDNPALLEIRSSGADDVNMNGFYVKVMTKQ